VIVNDKNAQPLTAADVKNIYNDHVAHWANGRRVNVYELPVKNAAREIFTRGVLGVSAREAAAERNNKKITNTAKNPPATKPESLVISNVARDEDAIGYVSAESAAGREGVRVILTLE
jgi:ABC-type phosphate transport system substrate-binding protein